MTDPQIIQQTLTAGQLYLAQLKAEELQAAKTGCQCSCNCDDIDKLATTVSAQSYQVANGIYDGTTESLQYVLSGLVGNYIAPLSNVAWGFSNTDPVPDLVNFTFQFSEPFVIGTSSLTLNMTANADLKYWIFRFPINQPAFTNFVNVTPFSQGQIPGSTLYNLITSGYYYVISRNLTPLQKTVSTLVTLTR